MATFIVDDLTDPHEFVQEYPGVPCISDYLKKNVQVGYYVKLRRNGAFFWVHVKEIDGTSITGEIYHPLSCNAQFTIGDLIVFDICYAFDIYDALIFNLIPRIDQVTSIP
jgi:hypothetical protein